MKYYIYDTEKGYEEFEDLKVAAEKYLNLEFTRVFCFWYYRRNGCC